MKKKKEEENKLNQKQIAKKNKRKKKNKLILCPAKFEKKILGGGLRKNTEILRNPGGSPTKKHKKFTPPTKKR